MGQSKLDRGTKIYTGVLAAIALAILIAWVLSLNPRVWEINSRLEQDPRISTYPFPFRVLQIDKGVAVVSSPRSAQVPAMQFLGLIDSALRNADPSSAASIAAQKALAEVQDRVRGLVEAEPDIERVTWRLDKNWLFAHGVQLRP